MTVTYAQLEGAFKQRYGKLEKAVPSFGICQKRWKFQNAKRLGDTYNFPVLLQRSHGITFAGESASQPVALNSALSMLTQNAQVKGTEFVLQEDLAYSAVSRAREQGEAAFFSTLDQVVIGMKETSAFYLEATLLYGQDHIGVIDSATASAPASTSWDIVLTDASWAPGLWAQMEGAKIDFWSSDLSTTHFNDASDGSEDTTVATVNADTKTISVTSASANFSTFNASTPPSAGDVITFYGAKSGANWNQFAGIKKIATNTGELFSINASTYGHWKANDVTGETNRVTMGKIHKLVNRAVVRGLTGKVSVYVPNYSWVDMMGDASALRRYAADTRQEMQMGTNKLVFHGVNGGAMEIVGHPMLKAEEVYVTQDDKCIRIGSSDITFRLPGSPDKFFQNLEATAAYRLRNYWDQALIHLCPNRLVRGSGYSPDSD